MPTRRELVNPLRALAMDALEAVRPGHRDMPRVMADVAQGLWGDPLRFNPGNRHWRNRDRFVLSNGQCSMLHCALLPPSGFDLSIGELNGFRRKYAALDGEVIGISGVGESAPASITFEHVGTTTTQVVDAAGQVVG